MTDINYLMRRYFENKRESEQIKRERIRFNRKNTCSDLVDYDYGTCIDNQSPEPCYVCVKRNEFHKQIVKLGYERVSILNKVKNLVKK